MDFFTPLANLPASGTSGTFTDFVFSATVSLTSSTLVGTFGTSMFRFANDFLIPSAKLAKNGFASSTTFSSRGSSNSGSSWMNSFGSLEINSFTSSASGKSGNDRFLLFSDFSTPLVKSSAVGICCTKPSWEISRYVLNARRNHFVFLPFFGFDSSSSAGSCSSSCFARRTLFPLVFVAFLLSIIFVSRWRRGESFLHDDAREEDDDTLQQLVDIFFALLFMFFFFFFFFFCVNVFCFLLLCVKNKREEMIR